MEKNDHDILWDIIAFDDLSLRQLFDIYQLRTEIFVVEQECAYQEVDEKDLKAMHVVGYTNDQELAAVARILPPGLSYPDASFGRVGVSKKHRKRGLAHQMTRQMISFIEDNFANSDIRISAQCYLIDFYKKHAFKISSEEYDEDGIPHIEMIRSSN